jgi:hypothetical protein
MPFLYQLTINVIAKSVWYVDKNYIFNLIIIQCCFQLQNAQKGDSELRSQYKVQAQKQKQMFIDLFKDVHRPNISNSKNLFVVSHDFVKRWKQFIR